MTKQEAKRIAQGLITDFKCESETMVEFCNVVIEALEQEPCEDAISRKIVLAFLSGLISDEAERKKAMKYINGLSSVNPTKTGHWIMPVQDDGMSEPIYYQVRCSECGFDLDPQTWHMELHQYGADKYCPNCGAKMESEK